MLTMLISIIISSNSPPISFPYLIDFEFAFYLVFDAIFSFSYYTSPFSIFSKVQPHSFPQQPSTTILGCIILGDPEVTANIYCKSRNHPNTDTQNYSTDLRYFRVTQCSVYSTKKRNKLEQSDCIYSKSYYIRWVKTSWIYSNLPVV